MPPIIFQGGKMLIDDAKIVQPNCWTFLYEEPNNGWWLKIDNANDLTCYHLNIQSVYTRAFDRFIECYKEHKDTGSPYCFNNNITTAVVMIAEKQKMNFPDALRIFRMETAHQQLEDIYKNGYIVFNKCGGYHSGPIEHSQFVRRKTFTWPDFKESDIRISQFPDGTHWYVRIGEMELHENYTIKWNTKEEAKATAMRYISKESE